MLEINLPRPHINQQKVLASKAKYKAICAGRQFGKSLLCLVVAIQYMLEGKKVAYICPTFTPLGEEFYQELLKYIPQRLIKKSNASSYHIQLINGGSIRFFSGESLSRFRGITKISLLVVDEMAHIPNITKEWGLSILPVLLKADGDIIAISTPRGRELFYSLYQKGQDKIEGWESWHFSTYDNPKLTRKAIENLKNNLTEFQYQQEMLALPAANTDSPISSDIIHNNTISELPNNPVVIYGCDVAKYKDYSVITGLDVDKNVVYYQRFQKNWEDTKNIIKEIANRDTTIPVYVDSTGVGDVIVEQLQLDTSNIYGFKFTTESKPKIIHQLIKDIEQNKIKYPEPIASELYTLEYKYTSTGHIQYAARQSYYDDSVMSLAIANYHHEMLLAQSTWQLY